MRPLVERLERRVVGGRAGARWPGYAAAVAGVAAMTGLIAWLDGAGHIANISILYLLVVIATAVGFGRRAAVLASVLAFFAFDWFFTEPRYHLTVHDSSEWLALVVFLVSAGVVGQLTALLQMRADEASRREREAAALAEVSWSVASQVDRDQALAVVLQRLRDVGGAEAAAVVVRSPSGPEVIARVGDDAELDPARTAVAQAVAFVLDTGQPVAWAEDNTHWRKGLGEAAPPGLAVLPLTAESRVLGALCLRLPPGRRPAPAERRVIEALAHHAGVVLERERLMGVEAQARAVVEADRLKTALLSMISHDFRSPLASILASATGLLAQGAPLEARTQRQLLEGIANETRRLNRMVENILALSRLEAGAWRPQVEPVPVEELLWAVFGGLTREQGQRIQVLPDPRLIEVQVDLVQLTEVLHNLLENALKYAPPGSPVELAAFAEGDRAVFEVRDRGPGLPPGAETQVFEPFYRAPHLRESAEPGIGMGLAVCKGLVEAHGGRLSARAREGGGTIFRLELPWETTG